MSTRLIQDRKARAMALRGLRKVLAALKEQAGRYRSLSAEGPAVSCTGPAAVASDQSVLEAALAFHAGNAIVVPEGATVEPAGPTPALLQLVYRLVDLLGLSDLEREFFAAGAAREVPEAWDGLSAYADWLEERGNEAGAARVRKLTPQPGDVLAFTLPRGAGAGTRGWADAWAGAVADSLRLLEARGVPVTALVLPHDARLDRLSEARMAELGWVRAGRLAGVREQCAGLAEAAHFHQLAARMRAGVPPP